MSFIESIGALFVSGVFGNLYIAAGFAFIFMVILGLAFRFSSDCWIACMIPLAYTLMFHPETALLPSWIWYLFAVSMGILLALGIWRMFKD